MDRLSSGLKCGNEVDIVSCEKFISVFRNNNRRVGTLLIFLILYILGHLLQVSLLWILVAKGRGSLSTE